MAALANGIRAEKPGDVQRFLRNTAQRTWGHLMACRGVWTHLPHVLG